MSGGLFDFLKGSASESSQVSVPIRKIRQATVKVGPRELPLREGIPVRLGRAVSNDLRTEHESCSSQHAQVKLERGRLWVKDLGSLNGTLIGEELIPPHQWKPMRSDDRLQLGKQEVAFDLVLDPAPTPRASEPVALAPPPRSTPEPTAASRVEAVRPRRSATTAPDTGSGLSLSPQVFMLILALLSLLMLAVVWSSSTKLERKSPPPILQVEE